MKADVIFSATSQQDAAKVRVVWESIHLARIKLTPLL